MIKIRNKLNLGPRQHKIGVWGLNWTWNYLINGIRDLINKCQTFRDQSET
jgi:hypothetical protein